MKKIILLSIFTFLLFSVNVNAWVIKWNITFGGEKIYHFPGCENYNETKINTRYWERWFNTEEEARKAGWRKAYNCPSYFKKPTEIKTKKPKIEVKAKTNTYNWQKSCDIKYPWTVYRSYDDKCICWNGKEYSIWNTCENKEINQIQEYKKFCFYSDGRKWVFWEISYEWNTCMKNWFWERTKEQKSCDKKYPWTIYRPSDDMCICPNGIDYSEKDECKPKPKYTDEEEMYNELINGPLLCKEWSVYDYIDRKCKFYKYKQWWETNEEIAEMDYFINKLRYK